MLSITRRRIFGWLSSIVGGGAGVLAMPSIVRATPISTPDEYTRLQKFFRDNPNALWAPDTRPPLEAVREQAFRLSEPFAKANPLVEYTAWIDALTDTVILMAYRLDRRVTGVERRKSSAVRRQDIEDKANLTSAIEKAWQDLTVAISTPLVSGQELHFYQKEPPVGWTLKERHGDFSILCVKA